MKSLILSLALLLTGAFVAFSSDAPVQAAPTLAPQAETCEAPLQDAPEAVGKGDCSFKSDCGGAKCCKKRCAWASGSCCSFDSDCGFKGAKCRSGKCSNAPDGKCSFNSECPSGKCSSGKCK